MKSMVTIKINTNHLSSAHIDKIKQKASNCIPKKKMKMQIRISLKATQTNKNKIELNRKTKSNKERSTLMVRACSELREALAKVSSSTKTAFLRSSFWSDSRFEAISVRLVVAPLHLSLPLPFSSTAISLPCAWEANDVRIIGLFMVFIGLFTTILSHGLGLHRVSQWGLSCPPIWPEIKQIRENYRLRFSQIICPNLENSGRWL
jgi:hypothetical protein